MRIAETKQNRYKYCRSLLQSEAGYSLTEILISAGLSVVVALAAGSIMISATAMSSKTMQNISTQSDLNASIYYLKNLASRGINVRYATGSLQNARSRDFEGYVRNFSYDTLGAGSPVNTLMYFNVDQAMSGAAQSDPTPTAVFFERPTGTRTGRISVVQNQGSGTLRFDDAQIHFDGITQVELSNPQYDSSSRVIDRITLTITTRYFLVNADVSQKKWCPPGDNSMDCRGSTPFRDVTKQVVLAFTNNQRPTFFDSMQFPSGAYLFAPVSTFDKFNR